MVTEALEDWTLTEVTKKVVGKVHTVRGQDSFGLDNTLDLLKKLPRPVMMLAMWGFRTLDFFGKMPKALTDEDINYSTVALSNLGSIRCPAVYHHLNNYGNNSIMVTIGTIHKEEVFQPDGSRGGARHRGCGCDPGRAHCRRILLRPLLENCTVPAV